MKQKRLFKRIIVSTGVLGLGLSLGVAGTPNRSAQASGRHYTKTPISLRGTWTTPTKKGSTQLLKITKYTFYVAGYQNGKKQPGSWGVSGKKFLPVGNQTQLFVSKHRSPKGYWSIGGADSDGIWNLKRVHHHGRLALKSWGYTLGPEHFKHPVWVSYYYHR